MSSSQDREGAGQVTVPLVEGASVDDDELFIKPKMRTMGAVSLGVSQSIDNSEGGVSKTFSRRSRTLSSWVTLSLGSLMRSPREPGWHSARSGRSLLTGGVANGSCLWSPACGVCEPLPLVSPSLGPSC